MKVSVSSYSFSQQFRSGRMTQLDCVAKAKEIGFDAIEFTDIVGENLDQQKEYAKKIREEADRVGIEINAFDCMAWHDDPQDVYLKQYRIAKAAGCKFYVASDAHSREDLLAIEKYCLAFIEAIGLTDDDRYTVPE